MNASYPYLGNAVQLCDRGTVPAKAGGFDNDGTRAFLVDGLDQGDRSFDDDIREIALIIMAKYPEAGYVKTRLGRQIGMEKAAHIAKALIDDLLWSIGDVEYDTIITGSRSETIESFRALYPTRNIVHTEGQELRGPRSILWSVFKKFCGRYRNVLVVNADTVSLTKEICRQAQHALQTHDLVLGPCANGGIYLIGMKSPIDLFTSLTHLTNPEYFEETLDIIRSHGITVATLPPLYDVDTTEDLAAIDWNDCAGWIATKECLAEYGILSGHNAQE